MLDFNDFQPIEDSSNTNTNTNPLPPESQNSNLDTNQINDMFQNLNNQNEFNSSNQKIDEQEQKRILARQKEAEERKEKINKKLWKKKNKEMK